MKKFNFSLLAVFALALSVAFLSSCGKDEGNKIYSEANVVEGTTFIGTHKLDIPNNILKALSDAVPVDPETGEKPDLTAGFVDTLILHPGEPGDNKLTVESKLLDITVDGVFTGDNKFSIPKTKYDVLNLGTSVQAEKASLSTSNDVTIASTADGSTVKVSLSLSANKVAGISIGTITIPTNGIFTKTTL